MYHSLINSKFVRWFRAGPVARRTAGRILLSSVILAVIGVAGISVVNGFFWLLLLVSVLLVLLGIVMLVLSRWLEGYALLGSATLIVVAILGAAFYQTFSKVRATSQDKALI